jgi:hypothetical protein
MSIDPSFHMRAAGERTGAIERHARRDALGCRNVGSAAQAQ